jgi:uncharacterized protein
MALLAARFSHLKAYLASDRCGPDALNFEQLLGFLYAVSSAPDIVDSSEWLRFVFCEYKPLASDSHDAQRAVLEALDLHHAINCEVFADDAQLPPDCLPRTDVLANLDPECGLSRWAQGFSVGHDWLEETWEAQVRGRIDEDLDWQLGGCMAVLCFFASREMAQALHSEIRADVSSLEDRARIMLDLFPDALKAYADIGRSLATGDNDEDADVDGTDADIVDACPCGSGDTYRECCGVHRILH